MSTRPRTKRGAGPAPASKVSGRDEAITRLVEIGLTLNEARCYVALLESAPATAGELAEASGVPRPKVYGILKSLERSRFCYPSGDRITTYRPVDPDLALGEWTRSREHERRLGAERDRELCAALVEALPHSLQQVADGGEILFELSGGLAATILDYERMIDEAKGRVDIVQSKPALQPPERWNKHELDALERGVQVRTLFATSEFADRHGWRELVAAGAEARVAAGAPLGLVVRDDGAEALIKLPHGDDPADAFCLLIKDADLIAPLQLRFNREWRQARSLIGPKGGM